MTLYKRPCTQHSVVSYKRPARQVHGATSIILLVGFAFVQTQDAAGADSCSVLPAKDCRASLVCTFEAKQCVKKAVACTSLPLKQCRAHSDCSVANKLCRSKGHTPPPTKATTPTAAGLECLGRYAGHLFFLRGHPPPPPTELHTLAQ